MGLFLLIFFGILLLFALFMVIKIYRSETERERQSTKNLGHPASYRSQATSHSLG